MKVGRMKTFALLALAGLLLAVALPLAYSPGRRASATTDWYAQPSGTDRDLSSVSAADAKTAWAAGGNALSPTTPAPGSGVLLKTSDGGGTWVNQTAPEASTYSQVSAVNSTTAWALEANNIWKTEDGQNWIKQYTYDGGPAPAGQGGVLYGVHAVNSKVAWVVGLWVHVESMMWPPQLHLHGVILKTADGGANWTVQMGTDLPPNNVALTRVAAADENNAWAVGSEGKILHTTDGATWVDQTSPVPHLMGLGICAADKDTAWIAGQYTVEGEMKGVILATVDSGSNWVLQREGGQYMAGVCAVDRKTAWAVGSGGTILKTYDGGANWGDQASSTTRDLIGVDAVNASTAWAVGTQGTVLKTDNGGDPRPDIAGISPASGPSGAVVTIDGSDFGPGPGPGAWVMFGPAQSAEYPQWTESQIKCRVPDGLNPGDCEVRVTTSSGTSNGVPFKVTAFGITAMNPNWTYQNSILVSFELTGTGFQPGAAVRIERGTTVVDASSVDVVSDSKLRFSFWGLVGYETGAYHVFVRNPDGSEAILPAGFEIRPYACGTGSGGALLGIGLAMGLLSAAGLAGGFRRKRRKSAGS